ncbi:CAP domain-containing protein [Ornithinibacillus halotolerans]|uniref:Membrane protein YlbC n=1 Tax=Ornithinibacillus halotolerans TaxID=1274357 RepID=A0A916S6P7_9BACI|nr:CAP domain-containing protein [Ornithinibacillus halotolerans]GGA83736.1 putative membrane protein YlbC [Ornithinibacillus halotolerans]
MRIIKWFVISVVITTIAFVILEKSDVNFDKLAANDSHQLIGKKTDINRKHLPENIITSLKYKGEMFGWVGKSTEELVEAYGEPKRKDLSSYGYTWWIYPQNDTKYIQFGVLDGKVETIFATGEEIEINPLQIGSSYNDVAKQLEFLDSVTYSEGISSYTFFLNEEDIQMTPLVKLSENLFLQLYFDTFTEKLSSVRLMTGDILLVQRPYGLRYRGSLPEPPYLSESEWEKVEAGMERQIFDITNVIRQTFNKNKLDWEENVSEVAFLHSKDMAENNYFSHFSPNGEGLKERLQGKDVYYFAAGENIAAQYIDAPAAVEGWLNSKGHREALLHDEYTHLGVGVYRLYYTQNFLTKPF